MSWIRTITPEQATGPTAEAYTKMRERTSRSTVNNLWQTLGLDPRGLGGLWGLRYDLMSDPAPLTTAQVEAIVLVVSATNGCAYCVAHHGPKLAAALANEPLARAVALDYREADLPARDRVLLDYAVALTCEPAERKLEDVDRLREYGFDDTAVLKATELTAYYNAVNRIVSGLGVKLEDGVAPWEFGAQR